MRWPEWGGGGNWYGQGRGEGVAGGRQLAWRREGGGGGGRRRGRGRDRTEERRGGGRVEGGVTIDSIYQGPPDATNCWMNRDQREAMRADPAFQREREEYRAKRRLLKDERDADVLQNQLGLTPEQIQAASSIADSDETGEKLAQRQSRLKALARDTNPQTLTFPAAPFSRELESACAALEATIKAEGAPRAPSSVAGSVPLPRGKRHLTSSLPPSKSSEMLKQLESNRASKMYTSMLKQRMRLPAFERQDEIVKTIRDQQVVVISGSTGCGKTTQIPQFVLDSEIAAGRGASCNIICTQPRRISAIGVAERVASEKAEHLGSGTVGYQIRLERRACDNTKLLFCTTGILLRRLAGDPLLSGVSHVFLDEVHERNSTQIFL